ncbi:hypothetical protein GCK71_07260 [Yersinia pestis]|nr:hypothetical protein [Yersinia pestis]QFR83117.1 hypothetical protein GCK71_07260 [Yersinia pestis]
MFWGDKNCNSCYHLSPVTCHLSPVTYHLPPTTYHLPPTTYNLSPFLLLDVFAMLAILKLVSLNMNT